MAVRPSLAARHQCGPASDHRPWRIGRGRKDHDRHFQEGVPSVVYITSLSVHRDAFSLNVQEIPEGTGSGFIWDKNGDIVTNFHVVQGGEAWQVTLADNTSWKARLVGAAPDMDLAVLKIDAPAEKLHPIPLGTSKDLQVGQKVFAIGNPFGLDQSLTTGVIHALNREIKSVTQRMIKGVIQTDAAINPGNSGGPLLDSAGRLIGVNTAIYSPSGAYAGIGFAIPVDTVNRIVPEIIAKGRPTRVGLGVHVAPGKRNPRQMGLPGLLIIDVVPDSPAAKAGLRPTRRDRAGLHLGDIITAIDGKPVKSADDLFSLLGVHKPGDTVKVTILRNGEEHTVDVALAEI